MCSGKIIEKTRLGSLRQFNEDLKKMRLVLICEVYKYHSPASQQAYWRLTKQSVQVFTLISLSLGNVGVTEIAE